ncbi:MAG: SMC-Scp complex subunit ScpB [Candidatus Vogelbacteria bacterium]|nr:SMC-Scp complex subunit ScpB [Candidatus Vogelbacteria bacterium]
MTLDSQLEAILFFKAEPVSLKRLAEMTGVKTDTIEEALAILETKLAGRGLILVRNGDETMLGTAGEASELIEKIQKDELSHDLGKAALETLSVILYRGPISRPDIDYIRGVNSSFILRSLLVRGLVDRVSNPADSRSYLYKPTFDLLTHLGVAKIADLPEYESLKDKIENFVEQATEENNDNKNDA